MKNKVVKMLLCMTAAMAVTTSVGGYAFVEPLVAQADTGDRLTQNGVVDFGQGTANITIKGNSGQSLVGKRFEIFRLFNAENSKAGESINYTFNNTYAKALKTVVAKALNDRDGSSLAPNDVTEYMVIDYIQSINNNKVEGVNATQTLEGRFSAFRYFVENVRTEIKNEGLSGDTVYVTATRPDNSVQFQNLQYGYYVVDEISTHDENDEQWFASSLCMVDTANPTTTINIKSDYPQIIKKIQEDDNKAAIGNDGWNDIADFEIGQKVPYKYESTIPDMNGYHGYYYAWHDKMDDALTFNSNKKDISIVITKGDKSYKVKDTEYNVITSGAKLDAEDTFMIEIENIKKIIDTQFNNIDNLGHNDYNDITVTLNYNAVLNEHAADDTGRPGFENDVRLEFSNDADINGQGETGYTPWDTVVAFTFRLNGLKTNNHDAVLSGAKFRLYSDADCQNEVFLKKKDNGTASEYVVINRDSVGGTDHVGGAAPNTAVEMESDTNGNFTIYGLDQGTYYLKETDAPDGYRQLLDAITITVEPTYTDERNDYVAGEGATDETLISLRSLAHIKTFYNGAFAENDAVLNTNVDAGSADINVVNEVGSKLPITGSSAMLIMLGSGVALIGGASALGRRKKSSEEE